MYVKATQMNAIVKSRPWQWIHNNTIKRRARIL